ncbi:MAG: bifunctional phosphopantothenoylcysteine decarboxylase/phosphopantothenate--cysteine ligase CoaBC [Flavobacteriales bacterium]
MLKGKKILLGITGSIAAYKSAWLVRLLVQHGAEVKVVVTKAALDFVTPITLSTLSKNPIYSDFTENKDNGTWTNHVELALWADAMIIAPLSANSLAKMATGQSDNFFLTTYMSTRCPVFVAPAMDHDMFEHGGTQANLEKLTTFGHHIIAPNEGELASGLMGKGRMAEPEEILDAIVSHFNPELVLQNKNVLITAGPTFEAIDPVRFIGNRSTGKMGIELAAAAALLGAKVKLVLGPTHLGISHPNIEVIQVESAQQMFEACKNSFPSCDIAIMAAAVADYRVETVADRKIKKSDSTLTLNLVKNIDIAATFGKEKTHQILVGFALETDNEIVNAQEKLKKKNFDLIVLNSLQDKGAGFGGTTNKITLFWPNNKSKEFGLKAKSDVAVDILTEISQMIQ